MAVLSSRPRWRLRLHFPMKKGGIVPAPDGYNIGEVIDILELFDIIADIAIIAGVILFIQYLYYRYHDGHVEFALWKRKQKEQQERAAELEKSPDVIRLSERRKAK